MRELHFYLDAGFPCIYLRTCEQERALRYVVNSLKQSHMEHFHLYTWKVTTGLCPYFSTDSLASDFFSALSYIYREEPKDSIYIFLNPREFLKGPGNIQQLRDTAYRIRTTGSHLIMIGSDVEFPPELEDLVITIDFDLPSEMELRYIFSNLINKYKSELTSVVSEEEISLAAKNATGLSAFRAESAIALSLVETGGVSLSLIREEKRQVIRQASALEYLTADETLEDLGGFDALKEHVLDRAKYFEDPDAAKEFGIINPPRGVLIIGIAGVGKSLAAKCIANALKLPLYRLSIGNLFKGLVGASEAEIKKTLKVLETVAPAVLMLDEFEKAVAGLESSGKSDSGVTSRVIGTFMTWTAETKVPIYKVASCNTIRNLDEALLRRGRWDEVFVADLPSLREIEQIFSIHLRKRGRDPKNFDLKELAKAANGFVGAEIESVVEESLYKAFSLGVDISTDFLLDTIKTVVPLSVTNKERIDAFRKWMKGRAKSVSKAETKMTVETKSAPIRKLRTSSKKEEDISIEDLTKIVR